MKIGFVFYGISEGKDPRTGYEYDFSHCWDNLKRTLIEPFVRNGNDYSVYVSTYESSEETKEKLIQTYNPKKIVYSDFNNSDSFTTKGALFSCLEGEDLDFVVATRMSIHFSRIIANENVNYDKINLLFPEAGGWWENYNFACDGLHMWNHRYTNIMKESIFENYGWPRGTAYPDTHGVINFLLKRIPIDEINMVSLTPENSNCNSFYTLCRPAEFGHKFFNEEVKERFKNHPYFKYHEK